MEIKLGMKLDNYARRNEPGDLNQLICELSNKTGIEYKDIMKHLPKIVQSLKYPVWTEVFLLHFNFKLSIIEIHYKTGISYTRIEKYISNAKKYIEKEFNNFQQ
jgi:hypothetical protein